MINQEIYKYNKYINVSYPIQFFSHNFEGNNNMSTQIQLSTRFLAEVLSPPDIILFCYERRSAIACTINSTFFFFSLLLFLIIMDRTENKQYYSLYLSLYLIILLFGTISSIIQNN